jgi:hypothetical protein
LAIDTPHADFPLNLLAAIPSNLFESGARGLVMANGQPRDDAALNGLAQADAPTQYTP